MKRVGVSDLRKRRALMTVLLIILSLLGLNIPAQDSSTPEYQDRQDDVLAETVEARLAKEVLYELPVKGRAPKTDYKRSQFGDGWISIDGCSVRNIVLAKQLLDVKLDGNNCTVLSGTLHGPYSGRVIEFTRGADTSDDVQIDHVVALSDAWQKGAQTLEFDARVQFANDPLNLLAVDGDLNHQKGSSDAASWLPPNKSYRCRYIARQIAVKKKYDLWVTSAEKAAMNRVLNGCGDQVLPVSQ